MRENALTSKTDIVDNIQTIGNQLQKREAKSHCFDVLMNLMCLALIVCYVEKRTRQIRPPSTLCEQWIRHLTSVSETV